VRKEKASAAFNAELARKERTTVMATVARGKTEFNGPRLQSTMARGQV
jgi:hypothetical protein